MNNQCFMQNENDDDTKRFHNLKSNPTEDIFMPNFCEIVNQSENFRRIRFF